ncbi:cyclopropane-fatty-acyl-phospholipid synthase [Rhizobium wenxiniae]|uniref:Cyclopropane-fatty-acyl-phospholipid synthase n=1 Tax=Rhizobium wenxiniae TaxID=1737357 RepID=A0A7W9Y2Y6_9HYPH|nr:cyclopropane-fatty-acyl-phospholipid synthase family protein [Rhizobium wenxiniae]MBB6160940.1 cyclopropane-fatty-acyl-phospholipid synthase [Rhizobium wenxiniae]GGF85209.1 cyclopropane-fatty-acyl-phospholipid synthase [Rhizobium wenxiniae]
MSDVDHKIELPLPSFSFLERILCRWANRLAVGQLTLRFASGREARFVGETSGPTATIEFRTMRPLRRLAAGGSLGFATSYLEGEWETPDLGAVMDLAIANEARWNRMMKASPMAAFIARIRHRLNRNSKAGSRRNIAYHYDLGNAFYGQWLDETMTYSSAIFSAPRENLADAQKAKYRRIIEELNIGKDDHVLEIGCGWGAFAEEAIRATGCRVTGLTLSKEQAAFAETRLRQAGFEDRADIRLEDYRDCEGTFTKIVSIEMFEAVGEENWQTYFDRVKSLLSPKGQALVQVITIAEERFAHYRSHADFIQAYIFPGGMLPSITAFEATARASELSVEDRFCFGRDYERTLLLWDKAFRENWQRIMSHGFDERFFRMWHYYLQYCAAGFRTGRLDVVQFRLAS